MRERESERERQREREREREIKRERARGGEREREREKERGERDRILRCIWRANRWRRGKNQAKKFTRQFSRVLTSGPNSLGFSRESPADMWYYVAYVYNEELVSPIGNQRVGIFPPKIKNSLPPITSFKMVSKIPGLIYSCRRSYVINL